MVPVYMVYACRVRECPYGREGKGKRTWTLDNEGKGKRTLNLQGEEQDHVGKGKRTLNLQGEEQDHVHATISWGERSVEPPPGLDDERVWPPPALVDAWVRKGKGLGKERGIDVWIGTGKDKGKDKGKGDAWNNEVLLRHVWDLVDAAVGKGSGRGKCSVDAWSEDMSDQEMNAWMEQRKGKGYVWP